MTKKDCFDCKHLACGGYKDYFCELSDIEPVYSGHRCGNFKER